MLCSRSITRRAGLKPFAEHRFVLVALVLLFSVATLLRGGTPTSVKENFSRYQEAYRAYQQGLSANLAEAEIRDLAAKVRDARAVYENSLNAPGTAASDEAGSFAKTATAKTEAIHASVGIATFSSNCATAAQDLTTPGKSAEEIAYDLLIKDLYTPSRKQRGDELRGKLQAFLATARNAYFVMQATFELASLEADLGHPEVGQKLLADYAESAPTKEAARLAIARIQVIDKEVLVKKQRLVFEQRQERSATTWTSFSNTSWLALPVKIVRLGSFLTDNIARRFAGRELEKLLDDYDQAVRQTMPKGSLDSFTNSRLVPCNDISLLVNGRASFARRYTLASEARSRILLQTLLYYNDDTGNKLADLLIERAQAGVEVKLIVDDAFGFTRKKSVLRRLQNGGVEVMFNNPLLARPWKANFRSHQKLFVVDDEVAIVGGMNIAQDYSQGEITEWGWRDTDIEACGPIVSDVVALFERNWENLKIAKRYETGTPAAKDVKEKPEKAPILPNRDQLIPGPLPIYFDEPPAFQDVRVRFLTTFPVENQDDDILDLFIAYLGAARQEVIFQSAYFIPRPTLTDAIIQACRRGVKVRIITNSIESNNHPNAGYAGRANYAAVLQAGAEIYEWRGAQTLHSKVSLFDNFAMTVGAYNMNSRSHSCDSEDVIAIEDRRVVSVFRTVLERDLQRCRRITMDEVQTWHQDTLENAKMKFFSLFQAFF